MPNELRSRMELPLASENWRPLRDDSDAQYEQQEQDRMDDDGESDA